MTTTMTKKINRIAIPNMTTFSLNASVFVGFVAPLFPPEPDVGSKTVFGGIVKSLDVVGALVELCCGRVDVETKVDLVGMTPFGSRS